LGEVHMEDELRRMLGKIFPEGSDKCADCGEEIDSEYVKQEHIMLEHAWTMLVANVEEIVRAGEGKEEDKSDTEEKEEEFDTAHQNEKLLSEEGDKEEEGEALINYELLTSMRNNGEELEKEKNADKEEEVDKEIFAEKLEEVEQEKEEEVEEEMYTEKEKEVEKERYAEKKEEVKKEEEDEKENDDEKKESVSWSTGIYFTCKHCGHKVDPTLAKSHVKTHGIKLKKEKTSEHYELVKKEYICKICDDKVLHAENVIKEHTLTKHSMGILEYENLYENKSYKSDDKTKRSTFLLPISSSNSSKNGQSPNSSEKEGMLSSERKWNQGVLYECNTCTWKTFHKSSVQDHLLKLHKIEMKKHEIANYITFEEKKYSCKICKTQVSHSSANIYQHIRKRHNMSVEVYELKYESDSTIASGNEVSQKLIENNQENMLDSIVSDKTSTIKVAEKRKLLSCDEFKPIAKHAKQSSDEVVIDDLHDILNQIESRIKSKTLAIEDVKNEKEIKKHDETYLKNTKQKEIRSVGNQIQDSDTEKDPEGDDKMIEDRIEFSDSSDDESN